MTVGIRILPKRACGAGFAGPDNGEAEDGKGIHESASRERRRERRRELGRLSCGEADGPFTSAVAELCMQKGLLVVHTGRESIKIGPPLTITNDALLEGVDVLGEAIAEVASR